MDLLVQRHLYLTFNTLSSFMHSSDQGGWADAAGVDDTGYNCQRAVDRRPVAK